MYLKYGSYTHALDEASVAITHNVERDADGNPLKDRILWAIRGELHGADTDAVIAAMRALEAAYATDGNDIYLLKDDQSTVVHSIISRNTASGVMITQRPSYPVGEGAELSTFRTYTIAIEAEVNADRRSGGVLLYREILTISGGGPRYQLLELRNGPPQRQLVSQQTPWRATQAGSAIGYRGWPPHPAPYWSEPIFDQPSSSRSEGLPEDPNGNEWPINWNYEFKSPSPINGRPIRRY
jgi:hypothetical protein